MELTRSLVYWFDREERKPIDPTRRQHFFDAGFWGILHLLRDKTGRMCQRISVSACMHCTHPGFRYQSYKLTGVSTPVHV